MTGRRIGGISGGMAGGAGRGGEYRRGRLFHRVVGSPAVAGAGVKVLDAVGHPGFRSRLLFWEGWGGSRR